MSERAIVKLSHQQLMADARASLEGKWGLGALTFFVVMLISGVAGLIPLVSLIIGGPFALGLAIFSLNLARNQEAELSNAFDGFQHFGRALVAYLLMILLVVVGLLLLIVPGIIVAIGLSQTLFILADEPQTSGVDALKKSWEMMKGYKMDYFILGLRFIPWMLLCILTLFIGFFWLAPYMQVTYAKFYDAINQRSFEDDITDHLVE